MTTAASLRLRFCAAALATLVSLVLAMHWIADRFSEKCAAYFCGTRLPMYRGEPFNVAVATFVVTAALAVAVLPRRHPHQRLGAANLVTLVRAALAAWAAGLLAAPVVTWSAGVILAPVEPKVAWLAVALATVFAVLDGVDGTLARRSGLASPFGASFDMEVDAFFILVLSALVWQHGKAGPWVLGCGLMRYAFVVARGPWPWMGGPLSPTRRGKAVAVVQFVGLAVALAPVLPSPASDAVAAATLALLTWSFALDVRRLWRARAWT